MIIVPLNILSLPLLIVLWVIDSLLFLAVSRLLLRKISRIRATQAYAGLTQLTDPLHNVVERWLAKRKKGPAPPWAPWFCVLCGLLVIRYIVTGVLVLMA